MNLNSKDDRILRNLRRIKGDNRLNNKELDNLSKNLGIAKEWIIEGDSYPIALRESPGIYTSPRKELIPYYDVDATLALDEVINDHEISLDKIKKIYLVKGSIKRHLI